MSKPKSSTSWEYTAYDISRSISYYSRDGKTKIVKTIMNPFGIPPKSLVGIAAQRLGISDPWSSPLVKSLISWITLWAPGLNLICILSVCLMILIPVSYISWSNPSSGRPREELVSFHENGANYPGAFGPSAPGSRIVKSTFAPQLDNPRVARYRRQVHGGGGPEAAKTEPEPLITNLDSQLGDEKPLDLGPMTSFFNNEILDRFTREHSCTNDTTILKILLNDSLYNKHRLPATDGVEVRVEFWVQEVSSVSEQTSEFVADIYINELWIDPGLRYDKLNPCKYNITLGEQILKRIWVPNSCFINSKQAKIHDSPFKNIFLMIYPNGTVWVNYRVKVTGPCDMDLTKFPMDSQTCQLVYESFNYNMDEVKMIWMPIPEPVYPLKNITLPDYDLYFKVLATWIEPSFQWIRKRVNWFTRVSTTTWMK